MTIPDGLALALFVLCWLAYGPLLALLARRSGSLNDDMLVVRRAWMMAMTHREVRIVDSQLMGHTINSAGFFASTNLLLIAAVAGILFGGEQALQGVAAVGAEPAPTLLLEAKLALGVAAVFCLLVWRQAGSPAARAVRSARRLLEPHLPQR